MQALERLRQIELFTDLADEDLSRVSDDVVEVHLAAGELLFAEGEPGDHAYALVEGTVEVLKATEGREALVAIRGPGSLIGEMALLHEAPRIASVRARTDAHLLSISKTTLDSLLGSSPSAARGMFRSLLTRMRETSDRLRHGERMAQLGTLTAGVAHELNNPAAAASRAAQRLRGALDEYDALAAGPPADGGMARKRALELLVDRRPGGLELDALARSDAEVAVEGWLERRGVEGAWQLAPALVEAGVDVPVLDRLGPDITGAVLADAARFLVASSTVRSLVAEIGTSIGRLSKIVRSLKGYSYLDRAPQQDVDVVQGIEDTLMLLGHKTARVRIQREFDPGLPTITAFGSELNQVWTNLIDNACDALAEVSDRTPTITLRAYPAGDDVVVEVEDNGPGVPPDLQPRLFEAFVTTKAPGKGTGLGLQISYRIVVRDHGGELTLDSEPGRTTFRVVLPVRPERSETPSQTDGGGSDEHTEVRAPGDRGGRAEAGGRLRGLPRGG